MSKIDYKVEKERIRSIRTAYIDNAVHEMWRQREDKKKAVRAKWVSRIIKLSEEGYSAAEIYRVCRIHR